MSDWNGNKKKITVCVVHQTYFFAKGTLHLYECMNTEQRHYVVRMNYLWFGFMQFIVSRKISKQHLEH